MVWEIEFSSAAAKTLKKMNPRDAEQIIDYMKNKVRKLENPRSLGKQLKYSLSEYWRYREGKWRILCKIEDEQIRILVMEVGHRSDIYD